MTSLRLQTWRGVMLLCLFVTGCLFPAVAQQSTVPGSTRVIVPPFVRYSGVLKDVNGNPLTGVVGVTFSLYNDSQSSVPVWTEVQNVYPDNAGHYSVILGTEKSTGLPTDIFISGEGRWLSVHAEGQPEQSRVLLLSVPYALKAADAETLGGKPASAYLLNPQQTEAAPASAQSPAAASIVAERSALAATITGGGTTDYIPLWTSSSKLGNSIVYQSTASYLGIGTTSPLATLDIRKPTGMRAIASGNGTAIYGNATVTSGTGKGVEGDSASTSGTGVAGNANAKTGSTQGVWGQSASTSGVGVYAEASATLGSTIGVEGISASSAGTAGVFNNTGGGYVLSGQTNGAVVFSVNGSGVTQVGTQSTTPAGILNATSTSATYAGVVATGSVGNMSHPSGTDGLDAFGGMTGYIGGLGGAGVVATGGDKNDPSAMGGFGVVGNGGTGGGYGVVGNGGEAETGAPGVVGTGGTGSVGGGGVGVWATGGTGVPGGAGVRAMGAAPQVPGTGDGDGIYASNQDGGTFALSGAYAGDFKGDINVTGAVFAGTKDFKIDHPTDPANKYLLHASVESSEMMNIYSGNATLNGSGEAIVQLPPWFEAVNGDFRYQLTSVGAPGPGLYIAQEISGGRFKIAGGSAGSKVSWQVTGVRRDPYARAYPLVVEQQKNARERGYYIHPELYGAPKEKGIAWVRHPGLSPQAEKILKQQQRKTTTQIAKPQPTKTSAK